MSFSSRPLLGLATCFAFAFLVEAETVDPHRLARDVRPTQQSVRLRIDPNAATYSGDTTIRVRIDAATPSFRLHAEAMDIDALSLRQGGRELAVTHEMGDEELLTVRAAAPLAPGEYELLIQFRNDFNLKAESLYRVNFEDHYYLFTQFEDEEARGAFPCWDEPFFKIPWEFTLSAPQEQVVVFNLPSASESSEAGWRTLRYEPTPPMPSYLVAMAVGPFELVPVSGMSVPGNIVCPKGKAHLAGEAASMAGPLLTALESYFGRPYPYPKLDFIAVPEFWPGAMENVGAITYRDTILLLDPTRMTATERSNLAYVHAHEMAHQWFGNLVTMEWWDDLWLNESFATWIGEKITEQVFPEFGRAVRQVEDSADAMNSDAQSVARAMRRPILAADVKMSDAALTYDKGSAVLGMFESFIGEETFREGILHYIESNAWGNATADRLWTAIGDKAGVDVASAMATFLDQPGVPRIDVNLLGDGRVELRQSRFSNHGTTVPPAQWQIPIVLRYGDATASSTHKVLLREASQIVELPGGKAPEWVHPNADERGYYRWSVDPKLLQELSAEASTRLNPRERVGLVGQLSAMLQSGDLDGGSYLEAMGRLASDTSPEVLDTLLDTLGQVRMALIDASQRPAFAAYVRELLQPAVERFGMTAREGEAEAISIVRPKVLNWLGIEARQSDVVAFAKAGSERFLDDPTSLDPSIASVCLRIAAYDADWKFYNTLKQRYEAAELPADRTRYLSAMGHFQKLAVTKSALEYAIGGKVRPQEIFSLVGGIGALHGDTGILWEWMSGNYDRMRQQLPEMFLAYLPYFAMGCSAERIDAAERFFAEEAHRVVGVDEQMAKVKESSLQCVGLRAREGDSVTRFLARYSGDAGR